MNVPREVILFSTADWDNPFWTNKQHMARLLAGSGFRVLYVESLGLRRPQLARKDLRRIYKRLERGFQPISEVQENLWVCSPLVLPFQQYPVARRLNRRILLFRIKNFARQRGFQLPIIWTYHPLIQDLLPEIPHSMLIYHCADDLAAIPGMPAATLRQEEKKLITLADLIFTTSRNLFDSVRQINPSNTYYHPNVADFAHFSRGSQPGPIPEDLAGIPRPRIGFVGAVSEYKLDFDLIADVARARKAWHWVLIGEVGEGQPRISVDKLRGPNIHLLGPKPYRTLPDYLRGLDVAVIPSRLNQYTASMFPMKFFEYLAAGKPVVATPLPALEDYRQAFYTAHTREDFVAAVERVLAGEVPEPALRLDLARKHTWEWRFQEMLKIIAAKGIREKNSPPEGKRTAGSDPRP